MMGDIPAFELKSVWSGVRPFRAAILIPADNGPPEWLQIIEICSQLWGGQFCVTVPTDGHIVSERFWQLLKILI